MSIKTMQAKMAQIQEHADHVEQLTKDYLEKLKASSEARVKLDWAEGQLETHKQDLLGDLLNGCYGI